MADNKMHTHRLQTPSLSTALYPGSDIHDIKLRLNHQTGNCRSGKIRETWAHKLEFYLALSAFALGLGNVWRFPYICITNGGGSFLLVYTLMFVIIGVPLSCLEMALGQFAFGGIVSLWGLCPLFKGIGYATVLVMFIICIYYNAVVGYILNYLRKAFVIQGTPWVSCENEWNHNCRDIFHRSVLPSTTPVISDNVTSAMDGISDENVTTMAKDSLPTEEFWRYVILNHDLTTNIENIGKINDQTSYCLLLAISLVFLIVVFGIRFWGKMAYLTAPLSTILIGIFLIRGFTLPGSLDGVKYYITPRKDQLLNAKVWQDAMVQVFFSLGTGYGCLLSMTSYNKFSRNNIYRDSLLMALGNYLVAFCSGLIVFCILGYIAFLGNAEITDLIYGGPGAVFVLCPILASTLQGSEFWWRCFLLIYVLVGLNSEIPGVVCLYSVFFDGKYSNFIHKLMSILLICVILFVFALPFTTQAGDFILELTNHYLLIMAIPLLAIMECIVVSWVYGRKRLADDLETMTGKSPNIFFTISWSFVIPFVILSTSVSWIVQFSGFYYVDEAYKYPSHAEKCVWILTTIVLLTVPVAAAVTFVQNAGSLKQMLWVLKGPNHIKLQTLHSLTTPDESWRRATTPSTANSVNEDNPARNGHIARPMSSEVNVLFVEEDHNTSVDVFDLSTQTHTDQATTQVEELSDPSDIEEGCNELRTQ